MTARPRLHPLTRPEQFEAVRQAARADDHGLLFPTHFLTHGPHLAGYLSLGAVPLVFVWLDRQRLHARDSLHVLQQARQILRERGARDAIVAVAPKSPFFPLMPRLGFENLGSTTLQYNIL